MSTEDFDLSAFENVDQGSFTVRDQAGEPLRYKGQTVRITMHGAGSKVQVAAERTKLRAAKNAVKNLIGGTVADNAEEQEFLREAEYLAACTISVENFPIPGGAKAIYANPKLGYITEQAQKFLANEANFKAGSGGI